MGYETVSTLSARRVAGEAVGVASRRDWLNVGERYTRPYREEIEKQIDQLDWTAEPSAPMIPGLGVQECIRQLRIPTGSPPLYAVNGYLAVPDGDEGMAAYSIYGIEGHYPNARVRLYVLDKGSELIPLCVDEWPIVRADVRHVGAGVVPADWDWIDGQVYVEMVDDRKFAVVKGRRWTRVHEYLSNGQLTARWFVDEATGEVREAASARQPKAWPYASIGRSYPLAVVRFAREEDLPPGYRAELARRRGV